MLKMSTGLVWALVALLEWLMALGYETAPLRLPEGVLWVWVLGIQLVELATASTRSGRFLAGVSGMTVGLYLAFLRGPELWHSMPADYARSRRAELFSSDFAGVPWALLAAVLLITPSAQLLAKWLSSGRESPAGIGSLVARGVAFLYWGVTLLVCLRYGAGQLLP
jgi:hypothetical protein